MEAHYQHQNPAERHIQDVEHLTNAIIDCISCSAQWWLLCMLYVVSLLNVVVNSKCHIPCTILIGVITDISSYLDYHFWQEVFLDDPEDGEHQAYWCGPAHMQGDFLTYHVLLCDTYKLVQHSNICPVKDPLFPNHNQSSPPANGDITMMSPWPVVHSVSDSFSEPIHLPVFSPEEFLGMRFIQDHEGQNFWAKVIHKLLDCDAQDHHSIKLLLPLCDGELREIISYPFTDPPY